MNSENQQDLTEYKDELDRKYNLSLLYDFYGELIKEHNRSIYEDYILNDLSLGEIAAEKGISRQGVHDVIKRTTKQLQDFEHKLKLMEKYNSLKQQVHQASATIKEMKRTKEFERLDEVEDTLCRILEQI